MIQKILIRKNENENNSKVRNQFGVFSGIFGIITNIILFIIKLGVGILANSVTIIADAFNNLSDSASCILTILGFRLTNKPADQKHPYGYARYEYITGMMIAILMIVMGVLFTKSAFEKIISPEQLTISTATYIVLLIAILGKAFQMIVYLDFAKIMQSQTIKATAIDARNDIIATSAVLGAVTIMGVFKINMDGYMGLLVSIFILISAIKMLKQTMDPLLGIVPSKEQVKQIKQRVLKHQEIKGIHDLVIHNYGIGNDFVTLHAEVPADMDILVSHELMDNIEREFKEELGINLTIHTDPLELNDETTKQLQKKVILCLTKFDSILTIHDFRVVTTPSHTNIIFDITIPFEKEYTKEQLIQILEQEFEQEQRKYYFVITIDRPFS